MVVTYTSVHFSFVKLNNTPLHTHTVQLTHHSKYYNIVNGINITTGVKYKVFVSTDCPYPPLISRTSREDLRAVCDSSMSQGFGTHAHQIIIELRGI